MSLPVLHLSGTPYEQGLQHGRELKGHIAHNLKIYFERFERGVNLPREEVMARAVQYMKAMESQNADYFASLLGIADGSGFSPEELTALNIRYEILYYQMSVNAMADGCTAFAVSTNVSVNGHLLMGQNWDWIPHVKGAVLHTLEPNGLETLSFTEAGIVGGKIGLNSKGLGLAVNGMMTTDDDLSRLSKPFHVRCYEILRARDFDAALRVVTGTKRACSTNFLIAQIPDRVVDIEAAPDKIRLLGYEKGYLVHTNHFLDPEALGVVEPSSEGPPHSCYRLTRLSELLQAKCPLSIEDIQIYLCDHEGYPYSICRHVDPNEPPEDHYSTVISVIMDLHTRMLHLSDGAPCESMYQRISLA